MSISKYEMIGDLANRINDLSITEIIKLRMQPAIGGPNMWLCPFHDDHKATNFKVSKNDRYYVCYACGANGNGINFIQEYDNISWKEAVVEIAKSFNMISYSDAEYLLNANSKAKNITYTPKAEKRESKKVEQTTLNLAGNADTLNRVYKVFKQGYSLITTQDGTRLPKLTKEHREELCNTRFINNEDIENDEYFTFPNNEVMGALLYSLQKNDAGFSDDMLKEVPGFYYSLIRKKWAFTNLTNTSGIGIPIKNFYGQIIGIQIRLDKISDKAKRYQWFSSSFANSTGKESDKAKNIYGTSPGSPVAVISPDKIFKEREIIDGVEIIHKKYNSVIFVTEGFFKARRLTKEYGCYSLSVQGVTNWKHIVENINIIKDELSERQNNPIDIKCVYIAFDADMAEKDTVLKPALKMALEMTNIVFTDEEKKLIDNVLKSSNRNEKDITSNYRDDFMVLLSRIESEMDNFPFKIKYLMWDEKYGKGIDDLLNYGMTENDLNKRKEMQQIARKTIKNIDFVEFFKRAFEMLCVVDAKRLEQLNKLKETTPDITFRKVALPDDIKSELFYKYIYDGNI